MLHEVIEVFVGERLGDQRVERLGCDLDVELLDRDLVTDAADVVPPLCRHGREVLGRGLL